MRTTLDLDEIVLAVARAKARAEHISLGRAVSALVLAGLAPADPAVGSDFPMFDSVAGHLITTELVDRYRDDD